VLPSLFNPGEDQKRKSGGRPGMLKKIPNASNFLEPRRVSDGGGQALRSFLLSPLRSMRSPSPSHLSPLPSPLSLLSSPLSLSPLSPLSSTVLFSLFPSLFPFPYPLPHS
jgi:hypothetical protein